MAVGTVLTASILGITAYQQFSNTEAGCKHTWKAAFEQGLLPKHFAKDRFLMFPRDVAQLRQELEQRNLFQAVIGPSDSGKTWTYYLALEGRNNFIYLSLRGMGPSAPGSHSAQDFIKLVSHQINHTSAEPDIEHGCLVGGRTAIAGADRFFAELVNLSKAGILNVVFLASSREVVDSLKNCYSGRLSVKNHPYISRDSVVQTLADKIAQDITDSEEQSKKEDSTALAEKIVNTVGTHLGHVNDVLTAWTSNPGAATIDSTLDRIVLDAQGFLRGVLLSTEFNAAELVVASAALDLITDTEGGRDLLEDSLCAYLEEKHPGINASTILQTRAKLLRKRVLRDVDGSTLSLHSPVQAKGFLKLRETTIYQLALGDARHSVQANKEKSSQ